MSFKNSYVLVLSELDQTFAQVDESAFNLLIEEVKKADRVFVMGVGRVMLMLQAFVKRLNHLGFKATYVGAIDEPAITNKDLLIIGSGSGESILPLAIAKKAKSFGAKIYRIGSNPDSSITQYEDGFLRIPCKTKLNLPDEIGSNQLMSSLFEQMLLLVSDVLCYELNCDETRLNNQILWQKHANLE